MANQLTQLQQAQLIHYAISMLPSLDWNVEEVKADNDVYAYDGAKLTYEISMVNHELEIHLYVNDDNDNIIEIHLLDYEDEEIGYSDPIYQKKLTSIMDTDEIVKAFSKALILIVKTDPNAF